MVGRLWHSLGANAVPAGKPRHALGQTAEHSLASTTLQRHWRGLVAKRKEAAALEATRAARRAAGLPSEEEPAPVAEAPVLQVRLLACGLPGTLWPQLALWEGQRSVSLGMALARHTCG